MLLTLHPLRVVAQVQLGGHRAPTEKEVAAGYRFDRLIAKPTAAAVKRANFQAQATALHLNLGLNVVREHSNLGRIQTLGVAGGNLAATIAALKASGLYEYVEPDWIVHTTVQPNDPRLSSGELWGLHNTGQSSGVNDADIDAPEGWDTRHDAPTVIVAVIDTGVRYTHEDIVTNMWRNPGESGGGKETNGLDDDANGYIDDVFGVDAANDDGDPMDDNSHGTHCAGTIAGVGNNGLGVVGVAWQAQIMACKFLTASGSGSTSDAITCIDYARAKGAHVMSNSWGGGGYSQALKDAISATRAAGIIFVAAAGNESSNNDVVENYPSNYEEDNMVAVASTTRTDGMSSFSNYGFGLVEIGAPGSEILSLGIASDSDYTIKSGTSMATPHVAGALALLKAQFPADSYRQLINRLMRAANPIVSLQNRTPNAGRLNIQGALTSTLATPFNDSFAEAPVVALGTLNVRGSNASATGETGEPMHAGDITSAASVWWRWTSPVTGNVALDTAGSSFDTLLGVYTGSSVDSLTSLAGNDNASGAVTTSELTFSAVTGVTYSFAVSGKAAATGLVMLHLVSPPPNDAFASASPLSGAVVNAAGANRGGSKEPGEPNHAGNVGGHSVWWTWTAPDVRTYSFSTAGSSFDTLLGIYTGSAVNALTLVAENDNVTTGATSSRVVFTTIAGTMYRIAVDGKLGSTGDVVLEIAAPPVNDDFAQRLPVTASTTGTTVGASKQSGEPNHANATGGASVWWTWTAPSGGTWEINTDGSSFDTLLGVYTGTAVNTLTTIASDDDGGAGLNSKITFTPVAGTTYQIAVDGYGGDSGSVVLTLANNNPAPANDNFAARLSLASAPTTATGINLSATKELGEPNHAGNSGGASVWWSWVAPSSGPWEVRTIGSTFDTLLGIYTGAAVGALTEITSDDNSGGAGTSRATFVAVAGTTYQIAVDGYLGVIGSIQLAIAIPAAPPANDNFANRTALISGAASAFGSNQGASKEGGEPNHAGNAGGASVWWSWTAPISGAWQVSTVGSSFDTTLGIYTGSAVGALTLVAGDDNLGGGGTSRATFSAVAGTTYQIAVDGYNGVVGNIELTVAVPAPAPVNDHFADRIVLPGGAAMMTGTNITATKEVGEPNHNSNTGGASVWWSWTAPTTGNWDITTDGSDFDTLLGIYTGIAVNGLIFVASDDDSGEGTSSRVTIAATAGTTYQIAVDGFLGDTGSISLAVSAPPLPAANDNFANRIVLTGSNVTTTADSSLATKETGEPNHHSRTGGRSVWWSWTAPSSAALEINTNGSAYDTVLAVYTGTNVSALTLVDSDDDSGTDTDSLVAFSTVAGTTYQIAVDGYSTNTGGAITLSLIFSGVNQLPVAVADSFVGVSPGVLTTLDVRANDSDPENDPLAITSISNTPADATITHNGSVVSFLGGASFTSTGSNTFTYTINDGVSGPASAQVTVYRSAMAAWGDQQFGPNAGNPAIAGNAADPNRNGIPNLIEYALGGDPLGGTTGTSILPQPSRNTSGGCLQVNLTRFLGRNDITLTVQACDTLTGTWESLARSVNGAAFTALVSGVVVSETGSGSMRVVTVCDLNPMNDPLHPFRFMRLEVTP